MNKGGIRAPELLRAGAVALLQVDKPAMSYSASGQAMTVHTLKAMQGVVFSPLDEFKGSAGILPVLAGEGTGETPALL